MLRGNTLIAAGAVAVTACAGGAYLLLAGGGDAERSATDVASAELVDLDWEMLVPEDEATATRASAGVVTHEQIGDETAPWQADTDVTAVRADLDGARVRLPGYMTPLSFDEAEVSRFLLVPYVGACVHVPPPPANQIVYVEVDGTVPILEMWEPFLAVGTLSTQAQSTELAEVGYTMSLDHLEVYDEPGFDEPEFDVFDDTTGDEPPAVSAAPGAGPADADAASSELGRVFDEAFGPPGSALR